MKEKHKYGQYFTEEVIARYMVSLISHGRDSRVLEPSCGTGVFLRMLDEAGYNCCKGYEIDSELSKVYSKCVEYKSFLSVPTDEKYDVVIGNPPYIRWKNLEDELKTELAGNALWQKYFNSLCDYLFIFILKSIEHLTEGGELILICSDYWMNTTHSSTLRNYMVSNGYFERIYHFKEAPLFDGVNASFIIFKYIKTSNTKPDTTNLYTYKEKGRPVLAMLFDGSCFNHEVIPAFKHGVRWLLAKAEIQEELKWFESVCVKQTNLFETELNRIGDICDIGNGMVSGLDAAFKIKDSQSALNEKERNHSIKVLKAKNLSQYKFNSVSNYAFVPTGVCEDVFVSDYPHFKEQMTPYIDGLKRRYSYGKDLPYWEFAFPRSKSLFERRGAKIFVPCKERISHKDYFRFCYAPDGFFPLQDVTAIVKKENCRESVEYILAFLNSKYVYDWLKYNGIVKGEIVEFSETPIASIPFYKIDWGKGEEVRRHDEITSAVKSYIETSDESYRMIIDNEIDSLLHGYNRLQATA